MPNQPKPGFPRPRSFGKTVFAMPQQHGLRYSSCVAEKLSKSFPRIRRLRGRKLKGDEASPSNCESTVNSRMPAHFWGVGHGNPVLYSVECMDIWLRSANADIMAGKVCHLLSCMTAQQLGHAIVEAGALAYFGYYHSFWFMIVDNPCESRAVTCMHRCDLEVEVALLSKGKTTGQAKEDALKSFDEEIEYWADGEGSSKWYAWMVVMVLEIDKDGFRMYGDSGVRVALPLPGPIRQGQGL